MPSTAGVLAASEEASAGLAPDAADPHDGRRRVVMKRGRPGRQSRGGASSRAAHQSPSGNAACDRMCSTNSRLSDLRVTIVIVKKLVIFTLFCFELSEWKLAPYMMQCALRLELR